MFEITLLSGGYRGRDVQQQNERVRNFAGPTSVNGRPEGSTLTVGVAWTAFVIAALLLLDVFGDTAYGTVVLGSALVLSAVLLIVPAGRAAMAWVRLDVDWKDMATLAVVYLVVVGMFSLAFQVFTTGNVLGLFLSFGGALVIGVAAPVYYMVWYRGRSLQDLGLGLHNWRRTLVLALSFAATQFAITLWGFNLPQPVDWVPLLVMALAVGAFESVFFRGFIQGRLEASFGTLPSVAGASLLYALYHVGYGMNLNEMAFLFGLGIVYAVAYRLTENLLVLWPLFTPLGSFFAQLNSGMLEGELPWASIAGFADVLGLIVLVLVLAHRHETGKSRRRRRVPELVAP